MVAGDVYDLLIWILDLEKVVGFLDVIQSALSGSGPVLDADGGILSTGVTESCG
jgi:hypothetical protein